MADLQPIGQSLQRLLKRWGVDRQFAVHRALSAWQEIVGAPIARVARPLRTEGDTLWVAVQSQTWAQELNFHKATILQRLNERIGEPVFKNLRLVVRTHLPSAPSIGSETDTPKSTPAHISLTEQERAEIAETFRQVSDDRLRWALIRAREASLRFERWCAQQGWRRCPVCQCYYQEEGTPCFLCRGEGGSP